MDQPVCAECLRRVSPEERLTARLGQVFHAECHERRARLFTRAARDLADPRAGSPAPGAPLRAGLLRMHRPT
jgi:hypothetical protein